MKNIAYDKVKLQPNYPWFVVDIVEGVDLNQTVQDGIAEVKVDSKFQGKYLNICKITKAPQNVPRDTPLHAIEGDIVCVWATAVETFDLFEYGQVHLVRNPDIFLVLRDGEF